jgi:hypothetical protein
VAQRAGVKLETCRFNPGSTAARYSLTGTPSLRQDSTPERIPATLGPDCGLPTRAAFNLARTVRSGVQGISLGEPVTKGCALRRKLSQNPVTLSRRHVSKVGYDGRNGKVIINFRSAGAKEICQAKG